MESPTVLIIEKSRWFRACLVMLAAGLAALLWSAVCTAPGIQWNPARLAPSFALARGLPIYALRDSGSQLGWFYGPVFPLWYLPVAFTDQPTIAHMLAGAWNCATWLLPLALVLQESGVVRGRRLLTILIPGAVILFGDHVTHGAFYFIHVDAVCLAAGLTACVALHRAMHTPSPAALHLAAVAIALSFWSKQLSLILYPALFLWFWWKGDRRLAGRFLMWLVIYGAVITGVFFAVFGAPELLFNTWMIQSHNPWQGGIPLLGLQLKLLGLATWVALPLMGCLFWLKRRAGQDALPARAASLVQLLLWVALWELPLGLIATLKAGGGLNSVHSLHYAFAAGLIYLAHVLSRPLTLSPRMGRMLVPVLSVSLLLPLGNAFRLTGDNTAVWRPYRGQEQLLALARAQPGRYYFPWNPLITIISDRRIRPLDDALYCLWHVGLEVPADQVRAALPRDPIILYQEPAQSHFALRYFPPHPPAQGSSPTVLPAAVGPR
ncbi:MAG: hypothetical protein ACHQ5A_09330 [Opitutales bacterium]